MEAFAGRKSVQNKELKTNYMKFSKVLLFVLLMTGYSVSGHAAVINSSAVPVFDFENEDPLAGMLLRDIVNISAKEFSRLTGKKMTLKERIAFSLIKPKMKKELKKDPGISVRDFLASRKKMKTVLVVLLILLIILAVAFLIGLWAGGWG